MIVIKKGFTQRKCDHCGKEYMADNRNLKRGWGLCCSKRCAAKKREMNKPGYDPEIVAINNKIRKGKRITERQKFVVGRGGGCGDTHHERDDDYNSSGWADDDQWGDCDIGIHD